MNKEKLGNKHLCSNCGTKFFDLRKTIPTCPNCGTEVVIKTKPRLGRPPLNKNIKKPSPEVKIDNEETTKDNLLIEEDDIEINDMDNLVARIRESGYEPYVIRPARPGSTTLLMFFEGMNNIHFEIAQFNAL